MKIERKEVRVLQTLGIVAYCKFSRRYYRTIDGRTVTATEMIAVYELWIADPNAIKRVKYYRGKRVWNKARISNKQRQELLHAHEERHHEANTCLEFGSVSSFLERAKARAAKLKGRPSDLSSSTVS